MKKSKPPTVVRKGQRKAYRKANSQEVAERVEQIVHMLGRHFTRTGIIRAFRLLNEQAKRDRKPSDQGYYTYDLDWRTIDAYISRAKEQIVHASNKTRDQAKQEAVAFYEGVIRDPGSSELARHKARERLDDIYGVDAPKQFRITTPPGQPLQTEDLTPPKPLPVARLREILEALEGKDGK